LTHPPDGAVLEVRTFTVRPEQRAEFHRISRDGTVPMMRRHGITVIAHGPCLNNDDVYVLVRSFPSEAERVRLAEEFYATEEWQREYEKPVMSMIVDYRTAVLAASPEPAGPPHTVG
jgi:NIPSNAP